MYTWKHYVPLLIVTHFIVGTCAYDYAYMQGYNYASEMFTDEEKTKHRRLFARQMGYGDTE